MREIITIRNSGEIFNKLKSKGFQASSVSTYALSTLYTALSHTRIKEKLTELIEHTFNRERSLYLACLSPPVKYFTDRSKAVYLLWIFMGFFSVLCLLCICARLFICALWSPAWKGLTS